MAASLGQKPVLVYRPGEKGRETEESMSGDAAGMAGSHLPPHIVYALKNPPRSIDASPVHAALGACPAALAQT